MDWVVGERVFGGEVWGGLGVVKGVVDYKFWFVDLVDYSFVDVF